MQTAFIDQSAARHTRSLMHVYTSDMLSLFGRNCNFVALYPEKGLRIASVPGLEYVV